MEERKRKILTTLNSQYLTFPSYHAVTSDIKNHLKFRDDRTDLFAKRFIVTRKSIKNDRIRLIDLIAEKIHHLQNVKMLQYPKTIVNFSGRVNLEKSDSFQIYVTTH